MALCAPLPERLGAYRLLRRLPSRDGTDVYAALEEGPLGFQREVLLKLAPYQGEQTQAARDLAREAAAVASLNHPGLVRMYEFFEYESRLVLVLERSEGTHLGRLLAQCRRRGRPLEDEAVFYLAHRVASALAHAHGRLTADGEPAPVVHRALGPNAVLLGWDGSVRLAGFGFAKILEAGVETTMLGLVRGVPGYMAPEQLRGEKVSERADVYQLALLVWEMLANRPPGALLPWGPLGPNGTEAEPSGGPGPIGLLRLTLPPEIVAALEAALEPDAARRTLRAADLERWILRTVDVEAGREPLRRHLATLRGGPRRSLAASRPRPRRAHRAHAHRLLSGEQHLSALASGDALALSSLTPPSTPHRSLTPPTTSKHDLTPPTTSKHDLTPPDMPASGFAQVVFATSPSANAVDATLPLVTPSDDPALGATLPLVPPSLAGKAAPADASLNPTHEAWQGGPAQGVQGAQAAQGAQEAAQGGGQGPLLGGQPLGQPMAPWGAQAAPWGSQAFGQVPALPPSSRQGGKQGGMGGRVAAALWFRRAPTGQRQALALMALVLALISSLITGVALMRTRGDRAARERAVPSSVPVAPPAPSEQERVEAPLPPPRGYGSLTVRTPIAGYVFINGVPYGPSERPVLSPCGRRFVRVGAPPEPRKRTVWLTAGVWTTVPCGESSEIAVPGAKR
ncbi:MAG: serine/threonine protein kinase [Polyangiaceae bacterium]|jgi:serine/threonine-protein kinase|nr:serine/threonine protein kinase [Polyangiaceae bacterium]